MAKIILSDVIRKKLANKEPPVTESEIQQCFCNATHQPLIDTREEHKTNPPTRWFVAETDYGRKIKIMYVPTPEGLYIKSAYNATEEIRRIYNKYAKPV